MDLNSFILEYRQMLSDFDIDNFKKTKSLILEGSIGDYFVDKIDPEIYFKYIDSAMNNYSNTLENVDMLDKFYSQIYKSAYLDGKNITLPLRDSESVKKIRPEYMTIIAKDYNQNMQRIINNMMDFSTLKSKYLSPTYENTIKNQIINSTDKIIDPRGFINSEEPTMVRIDTFYIQHNIIPFLRGYKQLYADLNKIANNIKTNVTINYNEITTTNKAIVNSVADPKIINMANAYKYNTTRQFMNITAYTTSMFIRKVSAITYNMMQFMNLYNMIYNYFPEGNLILHEAVIDGKISDIGDTDLFNSIVDGNFDVIIPHIQSTIGRKKMEIANIVAKKYNYRLNYNAELSTDKYPYDVFSYASLNKTITDIIQNLHTFEINAKDPNIIVDEILDKSNLSESFSSKYADTLANFASISYYDISKYTDEKEAFLALFNDLNHFEKNIHIISTNVSKAYIYIKELCNKYKDNTDHIEINQYNEIKSVLDQLLNNYKDYALIVAQKIIERLDTITDYVDDNQYEDFDYDLSEPEKFIPYDYNNMVELEAYDDIEENEKKIFENLLLQYESDRAEKLRGVKYIYEAEEVSADGNTSGVTGVKTNQNNQNNSTDNNNNNNDNNTSNDGSIIDKFKNLLSKVFNKFKNAAAGFAKRDSKNLGEIEQKIKDLDVSNMTLTVAKFDRVNSDALSQDINEVINTVSGINGSSIPTELQGKIRQAETYLTNIPEKIQGAEGFKDRMIKYYQNGKDGKNTLMKYTGDEIKTKLTEIFNYMSNYETMSNDITKLLDDLKEKAATAQKSIIDSGKANEGNKEETNENNTSNEGDKNAKAGNIITMVIKTYATTMCTVMEKKYIEYSRIFQAVFPNDTKDMKKPNPNTEENNSNENK